MAGEPNTNTNESRLEKMYKAANSIGGESKPVSVSDKGKNIFENSGAGGNFLGAYTDKGLNYSDSFTESMKRGINKNWWSEIVGK